LSSPKFILDVHLGKLARLLRTLGFDCLWRENLPDEEILKIQRKESRIVLSRDKALVQKCPAESGCLILSDEPKEQAKEVVGRFDLIVRIDPFTVCLECNGRIKPVEKEKIASRLEPETKQSFDEFFMCLTCHKIYWKGSHYDRMSEWVGELKRGGH